MTMCLHHEKQDGFSCGPCPSKLVPRKCPPTWQVMLWTPLEVLLVCTTVCVGFAATAVTTRLDLPVPGAVAAVVQGALMLLHSFYEGPRLQVLPLYMPALLLAVNATGMLGRSKNVLLATGIFTLLFASLSLFLCYQMPRLLSVGGRGPYAVAITTEHIRTAVDVDGAKTSAKEEELWPLELMAQVFYPVDRSCLAKLPWFPSTLAQFRRSLVPAWGEARRMPFRLTQAGLVGACIILRSVALVLPESTPLLEALLSSSISSVVASAHAWRVAAAAALFFTCLVSDLRVGSSRSAYKARYIAREQAKRIASFASMPGWLTEHVCGFKGPGYEAGHFHGPDMPCFPAAPLAPGERKRPLVIFSHGLGGNRALYSEHAAEMASHGYVAVFLEHNDGSGSSCMFPDGFVTGYVRPPNMKIVAAPENRSFRLAQLKRRGRELRLAKTHLAKLARGLATDFEACRRVGLGSTIDIKRPAFVGHSFGGATVLQELSDEISSNGDTDSGYSVAVIMDPWTFPISDEARAQGIRIPVVSITTDVFLGAEGTVREDRLIENAASMVRDGKNDLALQLRVKNAEHNNFSDSALFAPGIMRMMKNAGEMDGITFMDQVSRLTLCALEVFLRRRTESGDVDKTPPPADLSSVLLGSDLSTVFSEAWVRRGRAGGVLPPMDKHE